MLCGSIEADGSATAPFVRQPADCLSHSDTSRGCVLGAGSSCGRGCMFPFLRVSIVDPAGDTPCDRPTQLGHAESRIQFA